MHHSRGECNLDHRFTSACQIRPTHSLLLDALSIHPSQETNPWCALEVSGKSSNDPNEFEPHTNDWAFCDSPTTCR